MDAASVAAILVFVAAALAILAWRLVPRFSLDLSLRGSTRAGVLHATILNKTGATARDVTVETAWIAQDGHRAAIEDAKLGDIPGHDAIAITVRDLQRGLDPAVMWDAIEVRVRAKRAIPQRARLDLRAKAKAEAEARAAPPPVTYARDRACVAPDGEHWFAEHTLANDGVTERWRVCRRCGLAQREPLSAADEVTQRRVRAERAAREQAKLDAELSRGAPPPHAQRRPPSEDGAIPLEVARWILGIETEDPTLSEIDAAYRKLAKEHHPDTLPHDADPEARRVLDERMRDLNVARETLRARSREAR